MQGLGAVGMEDSEKQQTVIGVAQREGSEGGRPGPQTQMEISERKWLRRGQAGGLKPQLRLARA